MDNHDSGRHTLGEYSRHRGVSVAAVSQAITKGRLTEYSVGRDEKQRPYIRDFARADEEWDKNAARRTKTAPIALVVSNKPAPAPTMPSAPSAPAAPIAATVMVASVESDGDGEQGELDLRPPTLIDSQTQANLERARKLRLENDVTESRLIPVDLVKKERFEADRIVRESILNLPARVSGELAVETDPARVQLRLELLLREALNAAADSVISDEALLAVNE